MNYIVIGVNSGQYIFNYIIDCKVMNNFIHTNNNKGQVWPRAI